MDLAELTALTAEQLDQAARILTLWLGSDDEFGGTNLYGVDLFPNVLSHAARVEQTRQQHPLTFYQKLGFEVVGLMPDVNGVGKPDILMAKRMAAVGD